MSTAQTYVLDRKKSVFFDFLTFLNNISRFPSIRDYYTDLGFRLPDAIFESYRLILKNMPGDFITALFFPRKIGKITFLCYAIPGEKLVGFDSIDDFLSEVFKLSQEELKIKLLGFYASGTTRTEKYYGQLLENPEALTDFVNGLACDTEQKWNLISFLNCHRPLSGEISCSLNSVKSAFEAEYHKNQVHINARFDEIEASCNGNPDMLLRGRLESYDKTIGGEGVKKVVFTVICSSPYAIDFLQFSSTVYTVLGIYYDKALLNRSKGTVDFSEYFKAFSDKTRVSVIRLLRYGETCSEDISTALSVPLPQLSHHLSVLESYGIVKCVYREKRFFYSLNISRLESMSGEFSGFVCELLSAAKKPM